MKTLSQELAKVFTSQCYVIAKAPLSRQQVASPGIEPGSKV